MRKKHYKKKLKAMIFIDIQWESYLSNKGDEKMKFKKANLFTIFARLIALIVSMLGTFSNNLYNDNEFVRAIWHKY